ncbi:hypothetical protein ABIE61_000550 [Marinobacterium sp. MBR-111]|uniref:hypothetical protein n=1 Tax=Marinobacterium sp. MBR-111 TaxID=3156463 RepID=UPI00339335AD
MKRFYRWFMDAWPIWAAALIIGVHRLSLQAFPQKIEETNSVFSLGLQIIGGLMVLYSIDSNLAALRGQNIWLLIGQWFRNCPLWSKPKTVQVSLKAEIGISASASGRVKRRAITLEERVEELERQVDETYKEMHQREEAVKSLVSDVKNELLSKIAENQAGIRGVEGKLDNTTLGGLKQQVFGVLIVIYGALLGHTS